MPPERRVLSLLLVGMVLILIGSVTAWFLNNFESQTIDLPVGASAEARRNPYLAAERLLVRLGVPVEGRAGRGRLRQLPPTTDTLVVSGLGSLAPDQRAALHAWLRAGGRLVVEAVDLWDDAVVADDVPGDFGIRLREAPGRPGDSPHQLLANLTWPGVDQPLTLGVHPDWYLDVEGAAGASTVSADGQVRMVRLPVGAGTLTVTSDQQFLTNDGIGQHDHALILVHLALPAPGGKVWLLHDSAVPWLGAILWATAPQAVIAAAVLVLVWGWSLGARLGPPAPAPTRRRRDLIEHLDAAGAFLWRQGHAAHLVEATRRQVLTAWQRRHPDLRRLNRDDETQAISVSSSLTPAAVAAALHGDAHDGPRFIVQTQALAALWRASRHRRGTPSRGRARPTQVDGGQDFAG